MWSLLNENCIFFQMTVQGVFRNFLWSFTAPHVLDRLRISFIE